MDDTPLVVGFDESAGARSALRWAIAEGAQTGRGVRAVHALSWPYGTYPAAGDRALSHHELDQLYRQSVHEAFAAVADGSGSTLELVHGDAGPVLVERSRGCAALVVGRPEHTGVSRLLVGSVAHHCLTHASCPVVTVPPDRTGVDGGGIENGAAGLTSP